MPGEKEPKSDSESTPIEESDTEAEENVTDNSDDAFLSGNFFD